MKIGITIPVYINNSDHIYFTKQTIESINTQYEYEIALVINYLNPEFEKEFKDWIEENKVKYHINWADNPMGNNVSGAWNAGITFLLNKGIEFFLVPNNDIVFHPLCIDNLVKFFETTQDKYIMWTALPHDNLRTIKTVVPGEGNDDHPGFSLFALSKESIEKLAEKEQGTAEPIPGMFDIGYEGAYFEDQDYHQRILRAGYDAGKTATALYYHFGSRTIKTDDELNNKNFEQYEKNRRRFESKWGYDSHQRGFENAERVQLGYPTAFNK